MNGLADLDRRAAADRLAAMGAFHTGDNDDLPPDATLVLFGPREPGFWAHVSAAPEFTDGAPDPVDRWSERVIGRIAREVGGEAFFPFGEPIWPFVSWALRSGRAWASPVGLLVHDAAGLMVSYRGAVVIPGRLDLPPPGVSPCKTCADQPCLTACPAGALGADGYDLAACHAYLDTREGRTCMDGGCQVRRACPISRAYGRDPAQSAYHMRQFH